MNNSKKTESKKTFSVYKPDGRHFTEEFKTAVCTMRIASQDRNPDHPVSAQRIARFWQGLGYAEINQSKISRILRSCPAFRRIQRRSRRRTDHLGEVREHPRKFTQPA